MKKIIITLAAIVAAAALVAATAWTTYRYTMTHIEIEQDAEAYYLTVYGQTDIYDI